MACGRVRQSPIEAALGARQTKHTLFCNQSSKAMGYVFFFRITAMLLARINVFFLYCLLFF